MRLKKYATGVYRRLTPESGTRALMLLPLIVLSMMALSVTILGLIHGADAAMTDEPLRLYELQQIEHEIWMDMGEANSLTRAMWGLLHWFVVVTIGLAMLAAQLGYALPVLGYPASWVGTALPGLFILLLALQLVRIIEVGWEKYAEA